MKSLFRAALAIATLVAMADLAQGATAGHMLKPAAPVANSDDDIVTGSIPKPNTTTLVKKKQGVKASDVTGSVKPKPSSGQ
jgi:hypothetical protein